VVKDARKFYVSDCACFTSKIWKCSENLLSRYGKLILRTTLFGRGEELLFLLCTEETIAGCKNKRRSGKKPRSIPPTKKKTDWMREKRWLDDG
jgi:hypothetical protein